jgi:hypothetical protein
MTTAKVAKSSNRGSKPGERRGGRQAGTPNKVTAKLKDMILTALDEAHEDGAVAYLKAQAAASPTAFLTLVGKVLPLQLTGEDDGPIKMEWAERALKARRAK